MKKIAFSVLLAFGISQQVFAHELPCPPPGTWADGRTGSPLASSEVIERMTLADAILLGESHGVPDIHLWQASTAAAISALKPVQYAYEMFPRSAQGALDAWSAGNLNFQKFLISSRWAINWGFEANDYAPILRLPRIQAAPAKALNVERALVRRVGLEGWANIDKGDREGLSNPAPAVQEYKAWLKKVLEMKVSMSAGSGAERERGLERFTEAQLLWDRAFAEGIKAALDDVPERVVVSFLGRGHVEFGYGVAHQLVDLGVLKTVSAVPVFSNKDCKVVHDGAGRPFADFIYALPNASADADVEHSQRPRIGVFIEDAKDGGATITRVLEGSPAAQAGFQAGDIIVRAAGQDIKTAAGLSGTIRAHTWGAWLPFLVKRGGVTKELVAKLPVGPETQ